MKGHTYIDLALRYEIDLCADSCGGTGHRRGWVDLDVVHFDPYRRITRSGLRRFLMLVSEAHRGVETVSPNRQRSALEQRAVQIHGASVFAYRTALHDLGIRLPAYLFRQDRARVRALLTGSSTELRRSRVGKWAGLR